MGKILGLKARNPNVADSVEGFPEKGPLRQEVHSKMGAGLGWV